MSSGGLSQVRLGRMHDVMSSYVENGQMPGLVTLVSRLNSPDPPGVFLDFWTSAYQAIDD